MELVYRVLWVDNQNGLEEFIENAFRQWSGAVPYDLIALSEKEFQIKEFRKKAQNGNRTTLRVLSQKHEQMIWVDVENENHPDISTSAICSAGISDINLLSGLRTYSQK